LQVAQRETTNPEEPQRPSTQQIQCFGSRDFASRRVAASGIDLLRCRHRSTPRAIGAKCGRQARRFGRVFTYSRFINEFLVKQPERHRRERMSELIRHAMADAIATELKDPRVGFATVTRVDVSADFSHATVYVSVLGSEEEKARAMGGLEHASGFLRTYIARNLRIRNAPELHIELDRGLEHAAHIDELLHQLEDEQSH